MTLANAASLANSSAGSLKIRSAPYSFPYAGYYSDELGLQDAYGFYWSRAANSYPRAYHLRFKSDDVSPQYNDAKYHGYSVRCYYA